MSERDTSATRSQNSSRLTLQRKYFPHCPLRSRRPTLAYQAHRTQVSIELEGHEDTKDIQAANATHFRVIDPPHDGPIRIALKLQLHSPFRLEYVDNLLEDDTREERAELGVSGRRPRRDTRSMLEDVLRIRKCEHCEV